MSTLSVETSTSASSAVIRYNYSTWTGVAAAWESKHAWEDWEGFLGGSDGGAVARFRGVSEKMHQFAEVIPDQDAVVIADPA